MSTIDPNKKIQKVHTEQEMRMALNDFISHKHALHIPPQVDDADVVLSDAITELVEAREKLASSGEMAAMAWGMVNAHAICIKDLLGEVRELRRIVYSLVGMKDLEDE